MRPSVEDKGPAGGVIPVDPVLSVVAFGLFLRIVRERPGCDIGSGSVADGNVLFVHDFAFWQHVCEARRSIAKRRQLVAALSDTVKVSLLFAYDFNGPLGASALPRWLRNKGLAPISESTFGPYLQFRSTIVNLSFSEHPLKSFDAP